MFDKLLGSIFVVFIAGIIGLIGWGIYEAVTAPDAGYVIGHEYHPAWTAVSCHGTKPVICIPTYYPPRYCLVLRADDGNEGEGITQGPTVIPDTGCNSQVSSSSSSPLASLATIGVALVFVTRRRRR